MGLAATSSVGPQNVPDSFLISMELIHTDYLNAFDHAHAHALALALSTIQESTYRAHTEHTETRREYTERTHALLVYLMIYRRKGF
jgi:hypothetical protein